MALKSKTITANGSKGHHKFTMTVIEDAISTPNNYSIVKWSLSISPIHTGYDWSYSNTVPVRYSATVNGKTYSGSIMAYDGKSTATIYSGEETITHNADGKKSISFSFSITSLNQSYLTGSASNTGSMELTYIARAAELVDATSFFDEDNPKITYNNPTGNAVEALKAVISLDGTTENIVRSVPKTATSYTFELTNAERQTLQKATLKGHDTITVYFQLKTTMNGTTYTKSLARYMSVVNALPTIAPVVEDINDATLALTGNKNIFVKGYSVAQMTMNAQAYKFASIVYQKIEVDGKSSTNEEVNANEPAIYPYVEKPVFTFTAVDNRNLQAIETVTKTAVNYIKLTCNLETDTPTTSGEMGLTISGNYFNGSFGAQDNSLNVEYRYKASSGDYGEWIAITPTITNNTYMAIGNISGLDYREAYTFEARAIDKLELSSSAEVKVKTVPVFDWGENDFNFNVPVSISGTTLDYVVEQGTKDGWFFRKWSSGLAECWRTMSVSGIDVGEFNMNGFYYCGSKGVNFPFTFTEVNYVNATGGSTGNMNIVRPFNHSNTNMTYVVMGMADISSTTVTVNIEAKGKWKK